ncbi:MAG TPA: CDP-alcohol phosphatidyltransferase family protein [bacterium]|nr:CDP-alcohol phosphatidyltransferase family protein [bacterium]HPQ67281.1 CDP-alcohol phosphatidyltransferase family protein [bacterium]
MNLPNKITISRFFVPPLFIFALYAYCRSGHRGYYWAALGVFLLASISDGLDGFLARSLGQQTRLGALLDPMADKFFLNTALAGMAVLNAVGYERFPVPLWFAAVVLGRDLLLLAGAAAIKLRRRPLTVRPSWWGKSAAVGQMVAVVWVMLGFAHPEAIFYATAFLTVVSGLDYARSGAVQLGADRGFSR